MAFQALAIIGAGPAAAAVACNFNLAKNTVAVTLGSGDSVTMSVEDPSGDIQYNGTDCGLANTSNTTQIVIAGAGGNETVTIDNDAGLPFPSTISWQIALGGGTDDGIEIVLAGLLDGSVSVTNTGFTMNGGTGAFSGVEWVEVVGGHGNDTIDGSALTATGPSFSAFGLDGNDTITGGAGDDWLAGGAGHDHVEGQRGADVLYEGTAANGADLLYGGGDAGDTIDYSGRTNAVSVSRSDNSIDADDGEGCANGQKLPGCEGDDVFGVDTFLTGSGNDELVGEDLDGRDETFAPGPGDDTVDGKSGSDTLDLSSSAAAVTVDLTAGTASGEGSDVLVGIESVVGSAQGDILIGDANANALLGGGGADAIFGGAGGDTLRGGDGNDTVAGGQGNDMLVGGAGDDGLRGGAGNDTLKGSAGDDELRGGKGIDACAGGPGTDTVKGCEI